VQIRGKKKKEITVQGAKIEEVVHIADGMKGGAKWISCASRGTPPIMSLPEETSLCRKENEMIKGENKDLPPLVNRRGNKN